MVPGMSYLLVLLQRAAARRESFCFRLIHLLPSGAVSSHSLLLRVSRKAPASVQVNGNLPTGSYRMYAVVRAQSIFETFQGSCDQIYATMYSETSLVRAVYQVQVGKRRAC